MNKINWNLVLIMVNGQSRFNKINYNGRVAGNSLIVFVLLFNWN